jgi:hypothetical protein
MLLDGYVKVLHAILLCMRASHVVDTSGCWVVKRSTAPDDVARLRHEAELLGRAAHPGVVELGRVTVDGGAVELWTRDAGGTDLRSYPVLPLGELAGLGAAVATILADIHDLGIVHGGVSAEHVIVGADGHPVLCSLGRGGEADQLDPAQDVLCLRRVLAARLPSDGPRRVVRLLTPATGPSRREPTARSLAVALTRLVPEAALPKPGRGAEPAVSSPMTAVALAPSADEEKREPDPRQLAPETMSSTGRPPPPPVELTHHPLRLAHRRAIDGPFSSDPSTTVGVLALTALLAVVSATAWWGMTTMRGGHGASPAPVACPLSDDGCRALPLAKGRFTTSQGRFAIDLPGAIVVLGRWTCGATSLPVALDRKTGRIWMWDRWAGETGVPARPLALVPGAVTLEVAPQRSDCDRLEVVRSRGRPVMLGPFSGGPS